MLILNHFYQGDVLTLAPQLKSGSVNLLLTSPPYFQKRDYALSPTHWPEVGYAPLHGLPPITIQAVECCLGREKTIEAYVGHMVLVMRLLRHALRDDGIAWLNIGDSYANDAKKGGCSGHKNYTSISGGYSEIRRDPAKTGLPPKNLCGIPWRLALALQADGWTLRSDVIWEKSNGSPSSVVDRPTDAHEHLFLLSKNPHYWYDHEAIKTPIKQSSLERLGRGTSDIHKVNDGAPGQHPHSFHEPRQNVKFGGNKADGYGNRTLSGNEWQPQSEKANRRTVWKMATAQYPGSHFAVMPAQMAELCILSGCPPCACAKCGVPYERLVERTGHENKREPAHVPNCDSTKTDSTGWRPATRPTDQFERQCDCNSLSRPGVVLDPFSGSGTVAEMAIKHNRGWVGFELNPEYVSLATERINGTQRVLVGIGDGA